MTDSPFTAAMSAPPDIDLCATELRKTIEALKASGYKARYIAVALRNLSRDLAIGEPLSWYQRFSENDLEEMSQNHYRALDFYFGIDDAYTKDKSNKSN